MLDYNGTNSRFNLKRVVVVGISCAGKTTLAKRLAQSLGVAHIELDSIHWLPDREPRQLDEFRARTAEAVGAEPWVVDGNYSSQGQDIVWGRDTTVIWLNYLFLVVYWRTLTRVSIREELFFGNRESLRQTFLCRDYMLWWVLTTFLSRRR